MKRFLLFVGVAVAAMTASAQTKTVSMEKLATRSVQNASMVAEGMNLNSAVAAAPAVDALAGNYTQANNNYGEMIECAPVTISIDGANVKMELGKGMTATGTYDSATGVINVGVQECGSVTDSRGTFELKMCGLSELDLKNGQLSITDDLSFTVDDQGNIMCDQVGYFVQISKFTPAVGSSNKPSDFEGRTWTWFADVRFMPVNGVQAGVEKGRSTNNVWTKFTHPISIEDLEYSVNVYGYLGMGCLAIDVNEDGTVSVPMGQPMMEIGLQTPEEIETYGAYLCVYGVDLEGDKMVSNNEKETTAGTISGNTITITEYTRLNSLWDAEGQGYALNYYADNMTITLNEGNYLLGGNGTGIDNVSTTLEERVKNSKTYNLMGQQVNRMESKGLLIRDGKKYIKK